VKPALVVSCEHGGRRVPARYRAVLAGAGRALGSHRGWDPGALALARDLARAQDAPLLACTTSRLLVDTNRSERHPRVFSEWTRGLPRAERDELLERWWRPHRAAVEDAVRARSSGRRTVLHLSVHSFAARWAGRPRSVDVGLLYDPRRPGERAFAAAWSAHLAARRPELRVRRNRPYLGTADGLTTHLRGRFGDRRYLGIELEVSQRFTLGDPARWRRLRRDLVRSLAETLAAGWRSR